MIDLQLSDEKRWEALKKYREQVKPYVGRRIKRAIKQDPKKPEMQVLSTLCDPTKDELLTWCNQNGSDGAKEYIKKMRQNLKNIDELDILLGGGYAVMQTVIAWFQERKCAPSVLAKAFRYDSMRQRNPYFIRMMTKFCANVLDLTVCPYCNRNWVTAIPGKGKGKTEYGQKEDTLAFQIDHFFPKALYPYLAFSLFNLIPVCPYCNNQKLDEDTNNNDWKWYPYERDYCGTVDFLLNLKEYYDLRELAFRRIAPKENSEVLKITTEQTEPYQRLNLEALYQNHFTEVQEIVFRILQYQKSYWDMIPWIPTETEEETQESAKDEAYTEYKWKERELLLLDDNWESRVRRTPLGKMKHDLGMQLLGTEE